MLELDNLKKFHGKKKYEGNRLKTFLDILKRISDEEFVNKNDTTLSSKEKKELVNIYKDFESFDQGKIKEAIQKLSINDKFYKMAEHRYLNLIKALLTNDSTLESMTELNLSTDLISKAKDAIFKNGITYEYLEPDETVTINKIYSALVKNHIKTDKVIAEIKTTSDEEEIAAYYLLSNRLFDYFKEEAKFYSKGWLSEIIKKLSTLNMKQLMLNHNIEVRLEDEVLFLMSASTVVKGSVERIYIDVAQSHLVLSSGFWLMSYLPSINECDGTTDLAKNPLSFERYLVHETS